MGSEGQLEGFAAQQEGSEGHSAGSEGQTGVTDKWTDRQTNKQNFSPSYRTLSPLGAAAHKVRKKEMEKDRKLQRKKKRETETKARKKGQRLKKQRKK